MFSYLEEENNDLQEKFQYDFSYAYNKVQKDYDEIVFLCVGTDRITGDCFGPLVGTKLKKIFQKDNYSNINVYGSLDKNVNYNNIKSEIKEISKNALIIVIDAALSNKENIWKIFVSNNETILGNGLNKDKIQIGDISIKAVVGKDNKIARNNFKILQNISLNSIIGLANVVSEGIYETIKNKL